MGGKGGRKNRRSRKRDEKRGKGLTARKARVGERRREWFSSQALGGVYMDDLVIRSGQSTLTCRAHGTHITIEMEVPLPWDGNPMSSQSMTVPFVQGTRLMAWLGSVKEVAGYTVDHARYRVNEAEYLMDQLGTPVDGPAVIRGKKATMVSIDELVKLTPEMAEKLLKMRSELRDSMVPIESALKFGTNTLADDIQKNKNEAFTLEQHRQLESMCAEIGKNLGQDVEWDQKTRTILFHKPSPLLRLKRMWRELWENWT